MRIIAWGCLFGALAFMTFLVFHLDEEPAKDSVAARMEAHCIKIGFNYGRRLEDCVQLMLARHFNR